MIIYHMFNVHSCSNENFKVVVLNACEKKD